MPISSAVARPVRWVATELPYGRVAYNVVGAGTFTLGWHYATYIESDQAMAQLTLTYGLAPDDDLALQGRRNAATQEPTINRVQLTGINTISVEDALAALHDPDHVTGYWVRPRRRTGGFTQGVSDATRLRVAWIVSRLVEDFLDRDQDDALLTEHLRHYSTARVRTHEQNIRNARVEIADWQHRLDLEQQSLAIHRQIADGGPIPTTWPARPRWRDYRDARTPEGRDFLTHTTGSMPPH